MKIIGLPIHLKPSGLRRMLDALGEILDVRFEEHTFRDDDRVDAWIFPEADQETLSRITRSACPSYSVISDDQRVPCGDSSTIEFSRHHCLPPVLSGRWIKSIEAAEFKSLPQHFKNMSVLATKGGAPVWAMEEVDGRQHHYVSSSIQELKEGEAIFQYFHGNQFLSLLPLFVFLRALTENQGWEQPHLQACFMVDDPNLHWRTYGFVNFEKIVAHAQLHNYHIAFATIPLDTWFVHRPTALLFQQYHDQISLLIHGNNHIRQELIRPCVAEELRRNLRQALTRIDEFERRYGIEVSKVMAPPHGACNERALEQMAQLGFEAACISSGSLRHYNSEAMWLHTFGMKPSNIIAGLPVFHRFRISGTCHSNILMAALLDQPIVLVGHHHDVAGGLHQLADLAAFVNSLGIVHWADMKRISRSHYARRIEGKLLRVKMFTKRIEVCVPEGIKQIFVERPWLQGEEPIPLAWKRLNDGSEWNLSHSAEPIPVLPYQEVEIAAESPKPFMDTMKGRNFHLWPVVRRQLTEVRDRLAPVLKRVSNISGKSNNT